MIQRLNVALFMGAVINAVEARTGLRCYDNAENAESPFYCIEFIESKPANTKTMFVDHFTVWVHAISEAPHPWSSVPVLTLAHKLEEAMSTDIDVPEPFHVVRQEYGGMKTVKKDESGEGHAVLEFEFFICYGFKCK